MDRPWTRTGVASPHATETNQNYSGSQDRSFFVDLVKECIATDKVWVVRKRDGRQRLWAQFLAVFERVKPLLVNLTQIKIKDHGN
jgi:hypothetical protein